MPLPPMPKSVRQPAQDPALREAKHETLDLLQQAYSVGHLLKPAVESGAIKGDPAKAVTNLLTVARAKKENLNRLFGELQPMNVPHLNVLVVEDDATNRAFLRSTLEQFGHTVVGEAETAAEMVDMTINGDVELVVFDIRLGGRSGLDALEEIKQYKIVPAVAVTGYGDMETAFQAAQHNALGYLKKPIEPEELVVAVSVAYRNAQEIKALKEEADSTRMAFDNLKTVNKAKGILQKQNRWTEDDAFFWLQQVAMRGGMKIEAVAKDFIDGRLAPALLNLSLNELKTQQAAKKRSQRPA